MPENQSVRDLKRHEVTERILAHRPDINQPYAHYMAGKMKRLTQRRDIGFEVALRILGIHSDITARDAVRNMEGATV